MKTLSAVVLALSMYAGGAARADEPKPTTPPATAPHARKHKKPDKKPTEPKKPEAAPAPTK